MEWRAYVKYESERGWMNIGADEIFLHQKI
jgi:hypothetical protein